MFFEVGLRQSSPSLSSTPLFSCSCRCSQHPNECQQDKARQWLKCHPQRRGNRLELAGGTSPREFPCHCTDEAGKPSKARRGFVPSVSHRRRFLSLSSARSGCAQVQRDCSTSRKGVLVLWATTFKFCRQQRASAYQYSSGSSQVNTLPKQRAKPAASRTRTCTNAAVCIASGECPSRF